MADADTRADTATTPDPTPHYLHAENERLRNTLTDVAVLAQGAFGEIGALALLTLRAMEAPGIWNNPGLLGTVFTSIWGKAADIANQIDCMTGDHGCNAGPDEPANRRHAAWRASTERGTA